MWTIPLRSEKQGESKKNVVENSPMYEKRDMEKRGIEISKEEVEGLRGERGENTKFGKD